MTEFTSDGMDLAVYLDLSMAFDTINHRILIGKLSNYVILMKVMDWLIRYLEQRRQNVKYKGVNYRIHLMEYGVPQGSVLVPLLFIMYSNNII